MTGINAPLWVWFLVGLGFSYAVSVAISLSLWLFARVRSRLPLCRLGLHQWGFMRFARNWASAVYVERCQHCGRRRR